MDEFQRGLARHVNWRVRPWRLVRLFYNDRYKGGLRAFWLRELHYTLNLEGTQPLSRRLAFVVFLTSVLLACNIPTNTPIVVTGTIGKAVLSTSNGRASGYILVLAPGADTVNVPCGLEYFNVASDRTVVMGHDSMSVSLDSLTVGRKVSVVLSGGPIPENCTPFLPTELIILDS
jgi:hypothetical protein